MRGLQALYTGLLLVGASSLVFCDEVNPPSKMVAADLSPVIHVARAPIAAAPAMNHLRSESDKRNATKAGLVRRNKPKSAKKNSSKKASASEKGTTSEQEQSSGAEGKLITLHPDGQKAGVSKKASQKHKASSNEPAKHEPAKHVAAKHGASKHRA